MQSFKLVKQTGKEEDDTEEVTARVLGIICTRKLPPVTRKMWVTVYIQIRGPKIWKQYVQLTDMGHGVFESMTKKLEVVTERFRAHLSPLLVQSPTKLQYDGHQAMEMHCRYFTRRTEDPSGVHERFPRNIDPYHILEDSRGGEYISTADNIVQYCRKEYRTEGGARYTKCNPEEFEEGDVVEAEVAFACFRVNQNEYRPYLILRVLAKVSSDAQQVRTSDNQPQDDLLKAKQRARQKLDEEKRGSKSQDRPKNVKRKYIECESDMEVEEGEVERMKKMTI
ncbi:hypothetical protein BJ165DRAFT_1357219 [Panaeolus papilionaceus]|nr:hypothetical protein BJ165DRAFT_1357219 [Panaeolus papilionaceus]